jgi:hypothetical protein
VPLIQGAPKVISRPKPEQPELLSREAVLQNFEKHMGGGDSAQAMNRHFTKVDREKCGKVSVVSRHRAVNSRHAAVISPHSAVIS